VWDGNQPLHEWTALELDGHNTAEVITWLFEEGSQAPLAKLAGAKRYSILTDHLGTPLEMVDERGQRTWSTELSGYGQLRHLEGQRAACPFRYQGQYEDAETGLYYNRFRYYDPQTGAYISQDPIGLEGGLAPYAYVADPHKQVDIFGLSGTCPLAGAKRNPWNLFQRETKGQYGSMAERRAAYEHIKTGSPWPQGYTPVMEDIKVGKRVNIAMAPKQLVEQPGAFATKSNIPDVEFVREKLAVKYAFKNEVGYVQEYEVIKSVPVLRGPIGPQLDPDLGRVLKGGADQIEFKFPDTIGADGKKIWADRMDYLKPIGLPKPIK
jgi:RHS repeat-associated protein